MALVEEIDINVIVVRYCPFRAEWKRQSLVMQKLVSVENTKGGAVY